MLDNGYISEEEMKTAQAKPLEVNPRPFGAQLFAAESFAEEVRRELVTMYGKDKLEKGGLSVRTTLDPKLQLYARQSLARGLIAFDRKRGYRGPVAKVDIASGDWGLLLKDQKVPPDRCALAPRRGARRHRDRSRDRPAAASAGRWQAIGRTRQGRDPAGTAEMGQGLCRWLDAWSGGQSCRPMFWRLAMSSTSRPARIPPNGIWCRCPMSKGALVAMDPHTGRVLSLVGGFSYGRSQFNRAVQALRQPGSSFKPIVYAAALDNGYSPASVVLDAPIEFKMPDGKMWKPKNYQDKFFGPSTLRRGIEQSRNVMTVRLADELGMTKIADLAQRLGIYEKLPRQLAMALGAGETTLMKMVTAYAMIDNGGKKIEATLIDRIQDRYGRTIFRHDKRDCASCAQPTWTAGMPEPELLDVREQVMSPYTAYQITSMMEGVVERGTGKKIKIVGKPVAGKTGTSNDERDAWFIGYTPDLVGRRLCRL